ncbi:MAG: hypothetical protein AAFU78_16245 [Cyanobacteria bacterium J06633_2]
MHNVLVHWHIIWRAIDSTSSDYEDVWEALRSPYIRVYMTQADFHCLCEKLQEEVGEPYATHLTLKIAQIIHSVPDNSCEPIDILLITDQSNPSKGLPGIKARSMLPDEFIRFNKLEYALRLPNPSHRSASKQSDDLDKTSSRQQDDGKHIWQYLLKLASNKNQRLFGTFDVLLLSSLILVTSRFLYSRQLDDSILTSEANHELADSNSAHSNYSEISGEASIASISVDVAYIHTEDLNSVESVSLTLADDQSLMVEIQDSVSSLSQPQGLNVSQTSMQEIETGAESSVSINIPLPGNTESGSNRTLSTSTDPFNELNQAEWSPYAWVVTVQSSDRVRAEVIPIQGPGITNSTVEDTTSSVIDIPTRSTSAPTIPTNSAVSGSQFSSSEDELTSGGVQINASDYLISNPEGIRIYLRSPVEIRNENPSHDGPDNSNHNIEINIVYRRPSPDAREQPNPMPEGDVVPNQLPERYVSGTSSNEDDYLTIEIESEIINPPLYNNPSYTPQILEI